MAKISFKEWADARGKEGGRVFSKNRSGNYTKRKVTPGNPQSSFQTTVRANLTAISQAWRTITEVQRRGWESLASQLTTTNIFGDAFNYTGMNVFMKLNRNRGELGLPFISAAPAYASVTAILASSLDADTTGGGLDLTYSPAIPAGNTVVVFASAPNSAGRRNPKNGYRKIDTLVTADASPFDLAAAYIASYGALPAIGLKVFVKIHNVIDASGFASLDTSVSDVAS